MPQLALGLSVYKPLPTPAEGLSAIADYAQRLADSGGSLTAAELEAIDRYGIQLLRETGILKEVELWHLFFGSGVATHRVPIVGPAPATLNFYSDADCTPAGLVGDGFQKFAVLNVTPSSLRLTNSDTALTVYGTGLDDDPVAVLLSSNDGSNRHLLYAESAAVFGGALGPGARSPAYLATAEAANFLCAQTPNASYELIYGDGGELEGYFPDSINATRLSESIPAPTAFYLALAYDASGAGAVVFRSPATLRSLFISRSLSKRQVRALWLIVDQLNARLGRSATGIPVKQLDLIFPEACQPFQRDASNQADIRIEGIYWGTATTAIEARWGGAWQTIATCRKPGIFRGTLRGQSVGQHTLEVRAAIAPADIVSRELITVGSVFAILGQSNAVGLFTNLNQPNTDPFKVLLHNKTKGWREYVDPSTSNSSTGSIWGLVANQIMAEQGIPVAFICVARSSTNLVGGVADWDPDVGLYYQQAEYTIQQSGVNGLEAVNYAQGEGDAFFNVPENVYLEAVIRFTQRLKAALKFPSLKIIASQIGFYSSATDSSIDAIRRAIATAWNTEVYLWGPPFWDWDLSNGDGAHGITPEDAAEFTRRWLRAIMAHCYGGTEGRAPICAGGFYGVNSIILFIAGGSGALNLGGNPSQGFKVEDANGDRTITFIAPTPGGLQIFVDQPLTAPVWISLGSGNTGAGNTIKDSGVIPYPIEPFGLFLNG